MASDIDIANLALGHVGDEATVSSLDPPEGSEQAEHCAQFYPVARDALLEMHTWNFATKRISPAMVSSPVPEWQFAYALPNDCLNVVAVLPPGATSDYSAGGNVVGGANLTSYPQVNYMPQNSVYTPQDFDLEIKDDGSSIIYTNQQNALVRFVQRITDTTRFSPLFVLDCSWLLASFIAGPILKGEEGMAEAERCLKQVSVWHGFATKSDSNQRRTQVQQSVQWMVNR